MNVDNGDIRPWDSLTAEEKESGRWVKLTEDEHAMAERVDHKERAEAFAEMFEGMKRGHERRHPGHFKGAQ